jgi:hypothetical protein
MGRGSKSQAAAGVQLFNGSDLGGCISIIASIAIGFLSFLTGIILLGVGLDQKPANAGMGPELKLKNNKLLKTFSFINYF